MPRLYKYLCVGRCPDYQGESKTPEMNQSFSELKVSLKRFVLSILQVGKLRLREESGLPRVTGLVRALTPCPVLFPLASLDLSSLPSVSPRNAAAGLSMSPYSYLLRRFQVAEPCIFRTRNDHRGLFQPSFSSRGPANFCPEPASPSEWIPSFSGSNKSPFVSEQVTGG